MEVKKNWGGVRPGSGRPKTGRTGRKIWVTPEELEKIRIYLKKLREAKK